MSVKSGYGNLTETLESLEVLGNLVPSNRNSIIQIASKNDKRVITISCGYRLATGSSGTALTSGRLLVVGTKYSDAQEFISPFQAQLPDSISTATVYHDMPILGNVPAYFDSTVGIYIPKSVDVSVILTFCGTTGAAVFPASDPIVSFLNVQGLFGGVDKIFKDVE